MQVAFLSHIQPDFKYLVIRSRFVHSPLLLNEFAFWFSLKSIFERAVPGNDIKKRRKKCPESFSDGGPVRSECLLS